MSKKRYNLAAIRAKAEESVGGTDVEFEHDGQTYTFPHPVFAADEWTEQFQAAQGNDASVRVLLGDEQYEKFKASGGRAIDVLLLLAEVQRDSQGALLDGTPTRSSTS